MLKLDNLTQVIEVAAKETLERRDPVKKAERAEARTNKKEAGALVKEADKVVPEAESVSRQARKALPKAIVHAINRRDRGQCCYYGMRNSRCDSRHRVEIHHITPVSRGGKDTIENLVTLCHDHHKLIHETFFNTIQNSANSYT